MHRETLGIEIRSELAVGDTRSHGDGAGLWVQHHLVEKLQRDLGIGAVGDPVERVARAKRSQLAAALHRLLNFLDRLGKEQPVGTVLIVARPICPRRRLLLSGDQPRQHAVGEENARSFQELSLVHIVQSDRNNI